MLCKIKQFTAVVIKLRSNCSIMYCVDRGNNIVITCNITCNICIHIIRVERLMIIVYNCIGHKSIHDII